MVLLFTITCFFLFLRYMFFHTCFVEILRRKSAYPDVIQRLGDVTCGVIWCERSDLGQFPAEVTPSLLLFPSALAHGCSAWAPEWKDTEESHSWPLSLDVEREQEINPYCLCQSSAYPGKESSTFSTKTIQCFPQTGRPYMPFRGPAGPSVT